MKNNFILLAVLLTSVLSSCAAAGNMVTNKTWIGLLDIAAAAGIAVYILKGRSK